MQIHLYSPVNFEKWDWKNSVQTGIGGSETCHVELAFRLARRGYDVYSYSPLPGPQHKWQGVEWIDLLDANFQKEGLWIIFRNAECVDRMAGTGQTVWLFCQDESPFGLTPERAKRIDKVIALSVWHKQLLEANYPYLVGKIVLSSNGIRTEAIEQMEQTGELPKRNFQRLIYASSPDRGLLTLCQIFARAREVMPSLELHVFYGTNNIQKLIDLHPRFGHYRALMEKIDVAIKQPGITWHGRVGPFQLLQEFAASGIWCYPTHFTETSCITCMEAQAMGAVPITRPLAALAENVQHGVFIQGNPAEDALVRARYVQAILMLASNPALQERIRYPNPENAQLGMMEWARHHFNWERIVFGLEIIPQEVRSC